MKFDMHIHSRISDCSILPIGDIINIAADSGLDGVCITDHNSMEINKFIKEGIQNSGLCVIFGMEYDTPEGDFLIFGPYENIQKGLSAEKLLSIVKNTGGASIAAHPFRKTRPVSPGILEANLTDIIETANGRNSDVENQEAYQWASQNQYNSCGGSDAHSPEEIGSQFTEFTCPIKNRNDLIYALKNGLSLSSDKQNYSLLKSIS